MKIEMDQPLMGCPHGLRWRATWTLKTKSGRLTEKLGVVPREEQRADATPG